MQQTTIQADLWKDWIFTVHNGVYRSACTSYLVWQSFVSHFLRSFYMAEEHKTRLRYFFWCYLDGSHENQNYDPVKRRREKMKTHTENGQVKKVHYKNWELQLTLVLYLASKANRKSLWQVKYISKQFQSAMKNTPTKLLTKRAGERKSAIPKWYTQ